MLLSLGEVHLMIIYKKIVMRENVLVIIENVRECVVVVDVVGVAGLFNLIELHL
jgi:hypothetical protein